VSTVVEGSQDECVDAANGGLRICLPVEGDGLAGPCPIATTKMARRPACVVPTELAWRPTWEVLASKCVAKVTYVEWRWAVPHSGDRLGARRHSDGC